MAKEFNPSEKQKKIIEIIKQKGRVSITNNATAKALIRSGVCDWDESYNRLILTKKGKELYGEGL